MQPLDKTLRHQLERAVKNARDTAEKGAHAALGQLGVADPTPATHLSDADRELRRRLRAHGRQLGDSLNGGKVQSMDRLVEEVAYEHWHRMLFARFLAENNLLMYPDPDEPVAITLEECEDLATDEGAANGWELAARYAAQMLPQIFRLDSPVFQLTLPPEHQQALERLVSGLPQETFTASDSLGWVYQFWQANNKERINKSEVKIGARELPAVTQLFTEPYMVSFLLDNSLGAWWAARTLTENDLKNAQSEEELRQKAAIPGVPLEYLRFVKVPSPPAGEGSNEIWIPASGTFDAWPKNLAELKTLDPCCGSGHFLVAAFLMLVPMRMDRDSLSARDAVDAVLRENIHGLELDQRCVELAAFALALAAWKYPASGGYRALPQLHLACSGLSISSKKSDWLALAEEKADLHLALDELYKQFKDAPLLGSLINPRANLNQGSLLELSWSEVEPVLNAALSKGVNFERSEMAVVANGLAKAADILHGDYDLVFTNVPFRQSDDFEEKISDFFKKNYALSKSDIATVFHQRIFDFLKPSGIVSLVMPQGFIYKDYYSKYRKHIFSEKRFSVLSRLGARAFEEISGEEVKVILSIAENKAPSKENCIFQIDATNGDSESKKNVLQKESLSCLKQNECLISKKHILTYENNAKNNSLLEDYATFSNGIQTGDYPRFGKFFWEIPEISTEWEPQLSTVDEATLYGGRERCLFWGKGELVHFIEEKLGEGKAGSWIRGTSCRNKKGVAISAMGEVKATIFNGEIFDDNTVVIIPDDEAHLPAVWALCSSHEYNGLVREVDQSNKVRGALLRVPFQIGASDSLETCLPKPATDDPFQWIFHGHPCGSVVWDEDQKWTAKGPLRIDATVLQVAVGRLLGYSWPAELDEDMELADEQREWVKRCEALLPFADDDGIVCIPPVRGEASAADRLLNLLAVAYGEAWSTDVLTELLKQGDHAGKTLETWLRDKFFTQHCKLFQHRPFIWQIWDGLPDGFSALVNYHKLDRKNLETLIYTYLGDWTSRQKQDMNNSIDGAEERLAAAEALKKQLEQILEGEAPYDIFVRWKPIEQQPIGWEPDLNDGVRLNIRPFMTVDDVRRKDAGILRDKPNIKWTKDRGKDVESAPWYHTFGGERINDHHLTLSEKEAARQECSQ
ncbi:Eco57I restriction-modification methylase domain-containing protein [Marinobacter sp.]|uniref:Eco57I restriction-modification methylase domain-containing protein n=1 Tax=Marinobacter sp. TaxID=50741 RepID=UPI003A90B6F0